MLIILLQEQGPLLVVAIWSLPSISISMMFKREWTDTVQFESNREVSFVELRRMAPPNRAVDTIICLGRTCILHITSPAKVERRDRNIRFGWVAFA